MTQSVMDKTKTVRAICKNSAKTRINVRSVAALNLSFPTFISTCMTNSYKIAIYVSLGTFSIHIWHNIPL